MQSKPKEALFGMRVSAWANRRKVYKMNLSLSCLVTLNHNSYRTAPAKSVNNICIYSKTSKIRGFFTDCVPISATLIWLKLCVYLFFWEGTKGGSMDDNFSCQPLIERNIIEAGLYQDNLAIICRNMLRKHNECWDTGNPLKAVSILEAREKSEPKIGSAGNTCHSHTAAIYIVDKGRSTLYSKNMCAGHTG